MGKIGFIIAGLLLMGGSFAVTYAVGGRAIKSPAVVVASPVKTSLAKASPGAMKMSCCESGAVSTAAEVAIPPVLAPASPAAAVSPAAGEAGSCELCKAAAKGRAMGVPVVEAGPTTAPSVALPQVISGH